MANLLSGLHERNERFRVFLAKTICPKIEQLGALHKNVATRQCRLKEMLQVLAVRTSGNNNVVSKELNLTVRHLEDQNATLLRSLGSAEAALREERARQAVLKGRKANVVIVRFPNE